MIFEPEWRVTIGDYIEPGRGLLTRPVFKQSSLINEFLLLSQNLIVSILPKLAQIRFDGSTVFYCQCGQAHELVWFRTMVKHFQSGGDQNSANFNCHSYGFGLNCKNGKFGFRLYADGRITQGINGY